MDKKEVWLRGNKTEGLLPLLQPVADALYQAREEINEFIQGISDDRLWQKVYGSASAGFHLKHIPGFLDRLMTYAEGNPLSEAQLKYLSEEQLPADTDTLIAHFVDSIDIAVERMKKFTADDLTQPRKVGRAGLPATVIGLCIHSAEHTMRHTGQLLMTSRILKDNFPKKN